jgi:hypothetical protein
MARTVSAVQTRTNTTKTLLYKVPPKNTGLWNMMYIISLVGNETPKVYWYDSTTSTEYFIVGGKNLGVGEYVLLSDAHVALKENDEIRVQNTGTNSTTYIATIELRPAEAIQFHG